MFVGETAKWSGDYADKKRTFGAIYPDRGIDFDYFTEHARRRGREARRRRRSRTP